MKTSFVGIALSLGATCAAAGSQDYPYSISNLSLKHLVEGDTLDFTFEVTSRTHVAAGQTTTTCHTAWNNGQSGAGPKNPAPCANADYSFWFPTGALHVEKFELVVDGPAGEGLVTIAESSKYSCARTDGLNNVDEECKTSKDEGFLLAAV